MPQVAPLTLAICLYLIIHLTLTRTGETKQENYVLLSFLQNLIILLQHSVTIKRREGELA